MVKSSFGFFCSILWNNPKLFSQPNICFFCSVFCNGFFSSPKHTSLNPKLRSEGLGKEGWCAETTLQRPPCPSGHTARGRELGWGAVRAEVGTGKSTAAACKQGRRCPAVLSIHHRARGSVPASSHGQRHAEWATGWATGQAAPGWRKKPPPAHSSVKMAVKCSQFQSFLCLSFDTGRIQLLRC